MSEPDYMRVFDEHWRDLVMTDGVLDLDKVARELFDYGTLLDEVPKVYDHITNGRISKPNTLARHVIAVADDVYTETCEEAVKEARVEWDAEAQPSPVDRSARGEAGAQAVNDGARTLRQMVGHNLANCCSPFSVSECDAAMAWLDSVAASAPTEET